METYIEVRRDLAHAMIDYWGTLDDKMATVGTYWCAYTNHMPAWLNTILYKTGVRVKFIGNEINQHPISSDPAYMDCARIAGGFYGNLEVEIRKVRAEIPDILFANNFRMRDAYIRPMLPDKSIEEIRQLVASYREREHEVVRFFHQHQDKLRSASASLPITFDEFVNCQGKGWHERILAIISERYTPEALKDETSLSQPDGNAARTRRIGEISVKRHET